MHHIIVIVSAKTNSNKIHVNFHKGTIFFYATTFLSKSTIDLDITKYITFCSKLQETALLKLFKTAINIIRFSGKGQVTELQMFAVEVRKHQKSIS